MILTSSIAVVKGALSGKLGTLFAWPVGLIFLAAAEISNSRTLIVLALASNLTLLVVAIIGAGVSIYNSRKLQTQTALVSAIPQQLAKLEISLDGRLKELITAKEGVARAEGGEKERAEERDRVAADAALPQAPTDVHVVNPPEKPVPTKSTE